MTSELAFSRSPRLSYSYPYSRYSYPNYYNDYMGFWDIFKYKTSLTLAAPDEAHTLQIVAISGTILRVLTGKPVARAKIDISINRRKIDTKYTDSEGNFHHTISASALGVGTHTIEASFLGTAFHEPSRTSKTIIIRPPYPGERPGTAQPAIGAGILAQLMRYAPLIAIVGAVGIGGYIYYRYVMRKRKR